MPLLPFDTFRIETSLTAVEARDALAARVEPSNWRRLGRNRPSFEGEVTGDAFRLQRVIAYRNSFLPQIRGRITPTVAGSVVEGKMTLHPAVLGFMIFWIGGVSLAGGGMWLSMLSKGEFQLPALLPLGMVAFGWILTSTSFTVEAQKAKRFLVEMLAAPHQSPPASSTLA